MDFAPVYNYDIILFLGTWSKQVSVILIVVVITYSGKYNNILDLDKIIFIIIIYANFLYNPFISLTFHKPCPPRTSHVIILATGIKIPKINPRLSQKFANSE